MTGFLSDEWPRGMRFHMGIIVGTMCLLVK